MGDVVQHPGMKRGVQNLKAASSPDTTFFLLSNSNTVYIDTILEHQGLTKIFDEIVTNPAHFEKDGTLNLSRRVPANAKVQHTCKVGCSANMCKGEPPQKTDVSRPDY
jgi:pyridoxal phosphate phosphatase PHOSPHO2